MITHHRSCQPSPKPPGPTEDHSLPEGFPAKYLQTHIQLWQKFAQLPTTKLKGKYRDVLRGLQTHEYSWVFATAINPVALGHEDYFDIIKNPMNLGTIQKKLDSGAYHVIHNLYSGVRLTFENAMRSNKEQTVVHEWRKSSRKSSLI